MKLFVPAETRPGERRVAVVPDTVAKLTAIGLDVLVESGAGSASFHTDEEYAEAGAEVAAQASRAAALADAGIVVSVRALDPKDAAKLSPGALALSFLQPAPDADTVAAVASAGASAMSFDMIPRISRAQSMDALTSQALVSGYRCSLVAADLMPKFFPLLMTAAGTIPPAKVLVLGAGVAGLQAIATARRLGAVVSAFDVRAASADEVKSLGATFVQLELDTLEAAGGYAKEMSEDRAARQQELLTPYVSDSDALITTAAIPGRPAPLLVTADMVATMKPGSVVVDLAAESGGNVAGSVAGEQVVTDRRVTIWGGKDVPSQMPMHASRLYAMNVVAVLGLLVKDGELTLDPEDEIVDGAAVVLDGSIRKEA